MKANELTIGDLVIIEGYSRICAITEVGVYFVDRNGIGTTSFDRIEPIPLTAEILEKNGFVLIDSCNHADTHKWWYLYDNDNKTIFLMNDEYKCSVGIRIIQISFVHKLQHALRLCGIDKEIVL